VTIRRSASGFNCSSSLRRSSQKSPQHVLGAAEPHGGGEGGFPQVRFGQIVEPLPEWRASLAHASGHVVAARLIVAACRHLGIGYSLTRNPAEGEEPC
jgi:hypothetical protein